MEGVVSTEIIAIYNFYTQISLHTNFKDLQVAKRIQIKDDCNFKSLIIDIEYETQYILIQQKIHDSWLITKFPHTLNQREKSKVHKKREEKIQCFAIPMVVN